jgi:phosphoribosylanthranilate isomerase
LSRVAVKICGITEERDAVESALLGADALGFHFSEGSPRFIDAESAARICRRLPPFVGKVGVFVEEPAIRILEVVRHVGLTAVQIDGREPAGLSEGLAPIAWYKSFAIDASFDAEALKSSSCTTFLLRARRAPDAAPFSWTRARGLSVYGRILIGGGLDPTSVGMAVEDARPYGVDALASVEFAAGKKDLDRVELLIGAVRRAERRIAEEVRRP